MKFYLKEKLLLLFALFLVLMPFASADIITGDPVTMGIGGILFIFSLNFLWNFSISRLVPGFILKKTIFDELHAVNVLKSLFVITVLGLIIDVIAFFLSLYLLTVVGVEPTGVVFVVLFYLVVFVLLFIVNFLVLKFSKVSSKVCYITAAALALISNPALLYATTIWFLYLALAIIMIFFITLAFAMKNLPSAEKPKYMKYNKIFSILFVIGVVLLFVGLIVPMPWTPPHVLPSGPINYIGTAIKTVSPSGSTLTEIFEIKSNTNILASNFNDRTSLDAQSIKFFVGQYSDNSLLTVSQTSEGVSYVSWGGAQSLRARAKIICGPTADNAADSLAILDSTRFVYDVEELKSYCGDAQPCCAIVLAKP